MMEVMHRQLRLTRQKQKVWLIPQSPIKSWQGSRALIALGSSLGAREKYLQRALIYLHHHEGISLERFSSVWRTMPVGAARNAFYNMCIVVRTQLSARELMDVLLEIERKCDRLRGVHWMDRTLDLDIVLMEGVQMDTSTLQIPHPRMLQRDFVMVPALEVASDWNHPVCNQRLKDIRRPKSPGISVVGQFVIAKTV